MKSIKSVPLELLLDRFLETDIWSGTGNFSYGEVYEELNRRQTSESPSGKFFMACGDFNYVAFRVPQQDFNFPVEIKIDEEELEDTELGYFPGREEIYPVDVVGFWDGNGNHINKSGKIIDLVFTAKISGTCCTIGDLEVYPDKTVIHRFSTEIPGCVLAREISEEEFYRLRNLTIPEWQREIKENPVWKEIKENDFF